MSEHTPLATNSTEFNNGDDLAFHLDALSDNPNRMSYEELARKKAMTALASAEAPAPVEQAPKTPLENLSQDMSNIKAFRNDAVMNGIPKR